MAGLGAGQNLTQALLHALKARGATEIFGIPGDFALPLFRDVYKRQAVPLRCAPDSTT